ncbi:MAG: ketoacyl-ACP synthase III [Rhodospirillales bacterium]|nr:ketoacyl-ACP synthase III [Rhodospirillales bacterium]MDE0380720.1 ketoacyl-ACP synthase III [Rhodospirillales bacterium]
MRRSRLVGCGAYLPDRVLGNDELSTRIDTSDEWIRTRTGIRQRHVAADDQLTSDLACAASRAALEAAGIGAGKLDLLVLATSTPDNTFPATATKVQARLGMTGGIAFDVQAVCAGFVCALQVADSMVRSGAADTALIVGAETYSRILDWDDRQTCVLFGDGAGAAVLRAETGAGSTEDSGVLSVRMRSDGRHYQALYVDGGVSSTQTSGHLRMQGREVFRHAVANLAEIAGEAMDAAGVAADEVDWLVPHQANRRIIDATGKKLGIPAEKTIVTVDRHANTSSASIPLALSAGIDDGRITPGDLLVVEAIGGGLVWGAGVIRL